ncbi:SpoIIE family protein phosphatase [Streptomyces sp. NPDC001815]|uniref:SpoIIE family protein phosphatase n=1 Tax=Streptomyces sp. NPDC001815 TaxID=3154526 RepID=UPI00331D7802
MTRPGVATGASGQTFARAAAASCALLACCGLAGWAFGIEVLKSVVAGQTSMQPNTAVALLALSASLLLTLRGPGSPVLVRLSRSGAGLAFAIGLLTLAEYLLDTGPGIDQLLLPSGTDTAGEPPGRMSPNTALALLLAGLAQLTLDRGRTWGIRLSQVCALVVLVLGLLRVYGFVYQVPQLGQIADYTRMALHTALALVLLGVATFLARPGRGLAVLLMNPGTTGLQGRWMAAAALVVPPVLGWLRLMGQDAGLYENRMGTALVACAHAVVLTVVGFIALAVGRRAEIAHDHVQDRIREYAWLQLFMDHTPAAIFIKDCAGRYLAVNAGFERLTGAGRADILGRRIEDVLPRASAEPLRKAELEVQSTGRSLQRQDTLRLDDGPHHFLTTLFPLTSTSGAPYAVCGISTDSTERILAQQHSEQAQQRFRALLECAPDATLISDGRGTVVMANAQAEVLFRHPRRDLVGSNVHDLAPARVRRRQAALLRAYLAGPQAPSMASEMDLAACDSHGREFPVEVSLGPLETEEGLLVSLTIRDISDRKRAEAERAARYEQQHHIAYTLQRSLMGSPPAVKELPSARRYLASVQGAGVGGDWFDFISLGSGRTGIVIGDVMGRGLEAAAVMGQLRAAAHALAQAGLPPARLMSALDAFVCDLPDQMVTCCYLVIDHNTGEMTACSAGHPPVLLAAPGRPAHPLDLPVGVPLGVGGFPHHQTSRTLPADATLALYTDGLVERPRTDIEDQISLLTDALDTALHTHGSSPAVLEPAADDLLTALLPADDGHDDDVTLLLIHVPPPACARTELEPRPHAVPAGRRFLTSTLTSWKLPADVIDTARLLTSELLTNALVHAHGPLTLGVNRSATELTVEVTDHSSTPPHLRQAGTTDESGRGLALLTALAGRWGTRPHPRGKTVWYTLPLTADAAGGGSPAR